MGKRAHGCWWTEPRGKAHAELLRRQEFLEEQNSELRADNLLYLNIASNWNVDGSGTIGPVYWKSGKKIRRNVAAAAMDTAASFIAANRTIPSYQTTNADFALMRRAKQAGRVIHSQMWSLGAFEHGVDAFFDGAQCGTGITHIYVDPTVNRPALKRVLPNSMFVDAAEGRDPRSIYWVHFIAREWLQGAYPKSKLDLEDANGPSDTENDEYFVRRDNEADLVRVVEAWHLGVGKSPGRHIIATSSCTLVDEEYTRQRFPFAFYHYARRRAGFWGQGLLERMLPAQLRLSEITNVIAKCQDLASQCVYFVEENSNVQPDDLTNLPGSVYSYQAVKPEMAVWEGTPQDLVAQADAIWNEALEQEGLSQGVVGGELPQKGLGSARAVRAADDVASRRQVIPTRALEAYYLQIAQGIADANDDCMANDPEYQVRGRSRQGRSVMAADMLWEDVRLPDDCSPELTVMSMSAIPTTPQAKLAAIEELTAGGYMSQEDAMALMESPDIAAWQTLDQADHDLVEAQIEAMYDGVPELPIPNQNIVAAKAKVNKAFLVAYRLKAAPEIQDLFLRYIAMCDEMIAAMEPPPEEMPAEMPPMPPPEAAPIAA